MLLVGFGPIQPGILWMVMTTNPLTPLPHCSTCSGYLFFICLHAEKTHPHTHTWCRKILKWMHRCFYLDLECWFWGVTKHTICVLSLLWIITHNTDLLSWINELLVSLWRYETPCSEKTGREIHCTKIGINQSKAEKVWIRKSSDIHVFWNCDSALCAHHTWYRSNQIYTLSLCNISHVFVLKQSFRMFKLYSIFDDIRLPS